MGSGEGGGERGIALLVTMMAALLLVAMVGTLAPLATIETAVGVNQRRSVQGLYAAEAALALAAGELGASPDWNGVLNGAAQSTFRSGSLAPAMPDGSHVDLSARTDRLRAGGGLEWRLFAHGPLADWAPVPDGYEPWLVAVWIADDPADPDPDGRRDGNDAIVARASAFGARGASRAVEATLVRQTAGSPPVARVRLSSWRIVR